MKRPIRVLPITMAGAGLLLALKVTGLITLGSYSLPGTPPPVTVAANGKQNTGNADFRPVIAAGRQSTSTAPPYDPLIDDLVTGAAGDNTAAKPAAESAEKPDAAATPTPHGTPLPVNPTGRNISDSERLLLERLQQRREELEARSRELDVRENLLKAIEMKVEQRVNELKVLEQQLALSAPAEAAKKEEEEAAKTKLKDLVIMYESMKPKEAARVFDQLEMRVLVNVIMAMNPRKSSEIIAKMSPASAQKLTVALASQPNARPAASALDSLPKIEGQRTQ